MVKSLVCFINIKMNGDIVVKFRSFIRQTAEIIQFCVVAFGKFSI